jgi:NAD(P)-dependent dehydrogenase (short-subunit alcohol dehydrogenase family)
MTATATHPTGGADPLVGRTVVVTGGSDGIGRAAVQALVAAGAEVVMLGRNRAKTSAAASAVMSATGRRTVHWEVADLSRLDELREVADRLRERLPRIDVLVNNAGALFLEREVTTDGLERTFALNHLAYFALTLRLLDRVAAAAAPGRPSRVLVVSSRAHRNARLAPDDLQLARGYGGWRAYANSKLCNVLFTRSLAARLDPAAVVVHALHPGLVATRFAANNGAAGRVIRRVMDLVAISPEQGADTVAWLAHDPEAVASSGDYWVHRRRVVPSRAARDDALAERLWQESARLAALDADAIILASGAARTGHGGAAR